MQFRNIALLFTTVLASPQSSKTLQLECQALLADICPKSFEERQTNKDAILDGFSFNNCNNAWKDTLIVMLASEKNNCTNVTPTVETVEAGKEIDNKNGNGKSSADAKETSSGILSYLTARNVIGAGALGAVAWAGYNKMRSANATAVGAGKAGVPPVKTGKSRTLAIVLSALFVALLAAGGAYYWYRLR